MQLIGAHIGPNGSATAAALYAKSKPRVLKVMGSYDKVGDYRHTNTDLIIIGRRYCGPDDAWRSDPNGWANQILDQIGHPANQGVQAWEILNEPGPKKLHLTGIPDDQQPSDPADMLDIGSYELSVAPRIRALGKRVVFGNFAVGNPSGAIQYQVNAWKAYLPVLRAINTHGDYLGLHCYSVPGWNQVLDALRSVLRSEGLANVKVILTEAGHEPGWKNVLNQAQYAQEVLTFADVVRIHYSDLVLGFLLFTFNQQGWEAYDLEGADQLIQAAADDNNAHADSPVSPPPPITPVPKRVISKAKMTAASTVYVEGTDVPLFTMGKDPQGQDQMIFSRAISPKWDCHISQVTKVQGRTYWRVTTILWMEEIPFQVGQV